MKQAFYPLYKQNIAWAIQQESTFLEAFLSVPGCQTCMYKRGIRNEANYNLLAVWFDFYQKTNNYITDILS